MMFFLGETMLQNYICLSRAGLHFQEELWYNQEITAKAFSLNSVGVSPVRFLKTREKYDFSL
jgi:hypothetical protein